MIAWGELVDHLDGSLAKVGAGLAVDKIGDDQKSVAVITADLCIGKNTWHDATVVFLSMDLTEPESPAESQHLTVLGSTVRHAIDHVETFPAPANVTSVRFTTDELASVCPVTQQPDLSHLVIEYAPDQACIESKSLKLYLWSFRDRPVFAEALAAEIAGEIMATAKPHHVTATITQRPRGGIEVQAVSRLQR